MSLKLCSLLTLTLVYMASSSSVGTSANRALFATDLFHRIADGKAKENVVISPVSIQTCLALVYMGAEGKTAEELTIGLRLGSSNKKEVSDGYSQFFNSPRSRSVKIANKIFANKGYEIKPEFNEIAKKSFHSEAETLDFSKSSESVQAINSWVEKKTNNKIQNLLSPGSVDGDTSAVLINAIHFKALWKNQFSALSTNQADFWISNTESVKVDTMMEENGYKFGEFRNIDATVLEMPYEDDEMSMMILLPKKRDGLNDLVTKLKDVDIIALSTEMQLQDVEVRLPKFKAEFSLSLNDALKQMGISTLFTDSANLSGIFKNTVPVKVSEIFHKAFIDVNEAGSEAAAASFLKIVPMSLNLNQKRFIADHPFVWAIKDKSAIYFVGQVSKF